MGRFLLPLLAAFLSLALLPGTGHAKETPAYLALGDSLAFGVGASDPATKGYVGLTHDALRKSDRYRERGLELVNLGVPGATSADLLLPGGQLEEALREISGRAQDTSSADDNVEIISIDIGGNDLLALGTADSPCLGDPLGDACQQRFLAMVETLRSNVAEVTTKLRQAAPKADVIVVGLYNPYSGTGDALEATATLALQQLNSALRSVAAGPNVGGKMAEVFDLFIGRGRQWIAVDGLHPNDKGYAVIAEVLLAAIEGREPVIPEDLLAEPTAVPAGPQLTGREEEAPSSDGDDGDLVLLLAIAVPAAFISGGVITGAYFLARGRR